MGGGPEEDAARYVVESIDEDISLDPTDVLGAPDGTPDFALNRDGALVEALEVTMLMDQSREHLAAHVSHHGAFEAPLLGWSWVVALAREATVHDLDRSGRQRLMSLLANLEERGVLFTQRGMEGDGWSHSAFFELGVSFAQAHQSKGSATVYIQPPTDGARVTSASTHQAIEDALAGERFEGEREKLGRSGRSERHLFVWVMVSVFDAYSGIASEDEPANAEPTLPSEITSLWVAAAAPAGFVVWRSSGEPWQRSVVPSEGFVR